MEKPKKKRLADIAGELNLSIATVSRIINNKPDVNAKTKEKVLQYSCSGFFAFEKPSTRQLGYGVSLFTPGESGFTLTTSDTAARHECIILSAILS